MANETQSKKKGILSMRMTLILFAIVPLVCAAIVLNIVLSTNSSAAMKESTFSSMVSLIKETGLAFDQLAESNKQLMKNFGQAAVVKEYMKDPTNKELAAKGQAYTMDVYNKMKGWESIYISDWDSVTLSHPNTDMIGKPVREGDRLKALQDAMEAGGENVYNVGILTSPASGKLIMSMYAPVYDNGTRLGYIGGGFFVNDLASMVCDASSLGLSSAYIYFVDKQGIMLYHPDKDKIGNPVENDAVKGLVAKLANGEHPEPDCIAYDYKGVSKYAAYYVGEGDNYIAVLTADENDAMMSIYRVINKSILICVIAVAVFVLVSVLIARKIFAPLLVITASMEQLSTGDLATECNAASKIRETISIVDAFNRLKNALNVSMRSVGDSAEVLNSSITNVDGMTNNNVESVSQISIAIDDVAKTSQAVAENAQVMTDKARDLGASIEELNGNVVALYDASQTIKDANNDATDCMRSVYQGAKESVDAMQRINGKISETNDAITQIGAAVQAIESIAAQTNLLSLNASIEAARAGEAGKGFAVVADEIRSLADSSAQSAKEIKQIMDGIIVLSNDTVEISNRVNEVINKEQSDIEKAQEKFNVLSDSVEASITEIDTIKKMTNTLDGIKVELTNSTSDLGAISEELGASAEEVAASCQTVATACEETRTSTGEMRSANDDMNKAIEFFKLA